MLFLYTVFIILTFYCNLFLYDYLTLRHYNGNIIDLSVHNIFISVHFNTSTTYSR